MPVGSPLILKHGPTRAFNAAFPKLAASLYLLQDEFTTDDAAPLASPRTCEPGPGTLTAVQVDGQLSISGKKLSFPAQSTPSWGDLGFYGEQIARTAGRIVVTKINATKGAGTANGMVFGWTEGAALSISDDQNVINIQGATGADGVAYYDGSTNAKIADAIADATDYDLAVIARATGSHILWKPDGGSWTLLFVSADRTAAIRPLFNNMENTGTLEHFRVPTALWTPTPLVSDSFDRGDSTNLGSTDGAGAEESGGSGLAWTEVSISGGNAEIASNSLRNVATGAGQNVLAYVISTASNIVLQASLTPADWVQAIVRANDTTPEDDHWSAAVGASGNEFSIQEVVSGTQTTRASVSLTINAGTAYDVLIVADETRITAYLDGGNRISYGSATTQQTSVRHGIILDNKVGAVFAEANDFVVWNRVQSSFPSV